MEAGNAIEVKHISKSFKIYMDKGQTFKERVIFKKRRRYEERHVIKDISFSVKKGEAIGLIGHNGCGKSTTLKMLTKIMYPDSGSIEMQGRVSSLIELGAGFHPDMSGRENIYINASIFGLTNKEIDERLDDIIAFSELEEFIDNPVRTYSSGMYMRLAFAVAINVDADILLIDEILAVGDAAFQAKCFNKLREIKSKGTTIVIVSHSLSQIEQICERSIWIHEGMIREEGSPREVDPLYMEYMSTKVSGGISVPEDKIISQEENETEDNGETQETEAKEVNSDSAEEASSSIQELLDDGHKLEEIDSTSEEKRKLSKRWGSKEAVMKKVVLLDKNGEERYSFSNQEPMTIRIEYKTIKKVSDVVLGIAIYRDDQMYIYGTNSLIDSSKSFELNDTGMIDIQIDRMPVNVGKYTIDLAFHKPDGFEYDFWREVITLDIQNKHEEVGVISLPHKWIVS